MPDSREQIMARALRLVAHDEEGHAFEAVVPAIVQTSLFTFANFAEMSDVFAGKTTRNVYSRTTNPTVTLFEKKMAAKTGERVGLRIHAPDLLLFDPDNGSRLR
jgi:O-acetylhomoserine/O-acetylserine sulfhydrylase-like pyridoxal-dependent enzyme